MRRCLSDNVVQFQHDRTPELDIRLPQQRESELLIMVLK